MKSGSNVVLDRTAFARMKRIVPTYLAARRPAGAGPSLRPLPDEIAFKLTNQCNLRCRHCYQWNDAGHHHDLGTVEQRQHLPFQVISDVFSATRELASNLYFWGGEPLMYRHWDELTGLLRDDPRWTSICTNGLLIEKRLDSLLAISARLEIDVAVDGLEAAHDGLRGRGTFARALRAIELLLEHQRHGRYRGEVTVNCVVTDPLVHRLVEVVEHWDDVAIDTLYLGLPWYLSDPTSAAMDRYVERHDPWGPAASPPCSGRPSWHAYKHGVSHDLVAPLLSQLEVINRRSWRIKVRFNPALEPGDFEDFVAGSDRPAAGKRRCLALLSRMDVLPNGDVASCKFFPESRVGNLEHETVAAIWHGPRFQRVRETVDRCGLMPVCAKCSLLYSRGV